MTAQKFLPLIIILTFVCACQKYSSQPVSDSSSSDYAVAKKIAAMQESEEQEEDTQAQATNEDENSEFDEESGFYFDPIVTDSKLPEISDDWKRLDEKQEIWFDPKNKHVILGGQVCLRRGPLEMFACPVGIKEHESVVSVNCSAVLVHTGLLRVGAIPGKPVIYEPEYKPAHGTSIKVEVTWLVDGKPTTIDAKKMVRKTESGKPLDVDWVFGGSVFEKHPHTGETLYGGNAGMLICVSNFTIATMDLPIESTDMEDYWMFDAFTENIPDRGTRVLVTLKPVLDEKENADSENKKAEKETTNSEKSEDKESDKSEDKKSEDK